MHERHVQVFGNQDCNSISRLVPNRTNCYWILIAIQPNCSKVVNEYINYTKATKYSARIVRINIQFDREINPIHLGTEFHTST
jgi:hypothetical protein